MKLLRGGKAYKGLQLFCVVDCSHLFFEMQANVAWYTGGVDRVTLPRRKRELAPGVYTGRFQDMPDRVADEEDGGPDTPVGGITDVRRLGTISDFIRRAEIERNIKDMGRRRLLHPSKLMQMLRQGNPDAEDA